MKHCFLLFFILLILFAKPIKVFTQATFVLSGGGSKAFMHVGVLQFLEQNNVAIKNIGGSSMGGFIAALYASGYDVETIKTILLSSQSTYASDGNFAPQLETNFYDLNADYKLFSVEFEAFNKIGSIVPTSFISSAPLQFLLLKYFACLNKKVIDNYDSLMIPLRITASEIQQKKLFLFSNKSLVTNIRASMAYPFYMSAVEIEDSLLFMDGGLYNNFPISEITKAFNSKQIIGSLTSLPLPKANSKNIISQFLTLISRDNDYSIPANIDGFVVKHDVKNVSTFDFSNANEFIKKGFEDAALYKDSMKIFKELGSLDNLNLKRKLFVKTNTHSVWFDSIMIEGASPQQIKYLRKLLHPRKKIWNLSLIEKRFSRLAKDNRFYEFDFETKFINDDSIGIFKVKTNPIKKYSLLTGVNFLLGNVGGIFEFFGGIRYRFFFYNTLFDIEGNVSIGNYQASAESRLRIDIPAKVPTYFLWRTKYFQNNYFNWQASFLKENNPDYLLFSNIFSELSYTIPLNRKTNFTAGSYNFFMEMKYYLDNKIRLRGDSTDRTTLFGNNLFLEITFNNLNYYMFPTNGKRFLFRATFLDYIYRTNYVHFNTTIDVNQNFKKQNVVIETEFEGYAKVFNRLKVGIDIRAIWSNINAQKDYYATLLMLPYFDPVRILKNTTNENYVSDKFVSIGAKIILYPFKNYDKLSLRLENYHILKANDIKRNVNNGVELYQPNLEKQILYKLLQFSIAEASLVWANKIMPIAFSTNYLASSANEYLNFYLSIGYYFRDKKRIFY